MEQSSCTFHPPALDAWVYLLACHVICCVVCGVPLGIWAFYAKSRHFRWCLPALAVIVALSVPLFLHYNDIIAVPDLSSVLSLKESSLPIVWVGPFLAATFGFSTAFKLWNVAFQQFPEGADASLRTFLAWFLILPEPQFTKGKTRTLTSAEIQVHLQRVAFKFVVLSILLSMLRTPPSSSTEERSVFTLLGFLQLLPTKGESLLQEAWNGWIHLWFLYTYVSFFLELSIVVTMPTTGFQAMEPTFRNPLIESRSFQEVWGTRWNLPIQALLQRIAYIPLRKRGWSRPVAAMGTFVLSGILHEYNFWTHNFVAYRHPGVATLFFIAMGSLMLVEKWVWTRLVPASLRHAVETFVPSFVVAFGLMMISAIPVERYFIKSWLEAGMVEAVACIIPHFTCRWLKLE